ncbi:TPA: MFS transporter [Klebsiella pneumoniae]|uniref:MFS transporter n=1 Tax=Klebsiella pneumoniae TaxID=573 RepID=UPI0008FAE90F|nr:MFS transporter [Klebsiella pneumoniae]AXZ58015.1 MFS transporter [Klebsiella pneumoniae]OKN47576.1 methyl viologen resistance protein SmvA [Klebsiella pneumoniae]HBY7955778.1 MFS transporter [Klebsiella pneumoniae]HEN1308766.1 MFS transporter [Klebsiella pneumoniae]
MSRQWMTLMAILLVYIPVAIDATVLHVAAPTLSVALGSSGNELLWIIDIYSLVMAGMVLPMGALGDKIGFKRLLLLGSAIFGIASLCAALSPTAMTLIASRALLAVGAAMLTWFIRKQLSAARPMVDMRLFTHRIILSGVMMAMTALITLVGFELLMAQELQFVHQKTPFEAGIFMLPVMVASGFSGPIAGLLVSRLGLREVATGGMLLSAFSFLGLALTDFSTQQWLAWGLMTLLGFSVASALLASSSAIMAAAPKEKAAAAGAIETMAYELGAGLGIALFGLILTRSYSASIALPSGLSGTMAQQAASSIGEAVSLSQALPAGVAQALMAAAKTAFIQAHSLVLATAGVLLLLLAAGIWRSLATVAKPQSAL